MAPVYTDVITGDEMFSGAFPIKEVDNVVYEVDCQMVQAKKSSAAGTDEEEQEEEDIEEVNNVVHAFGLEPTAFTKSGYLSHLKDYMNCVKTHLASAPDQTEEFVKYAHPYAKKIISNFPEYEFYTGQSQNTMGMVALLAYRQNGVTPYFTFWKHGLNKKA